MPNIGDGDHLTWVKWLLGSMGSIIMLLLGVGVADVRNRLGRVDEVLASNKTTRALLEQIEKRLERIELECRERRRECAGRWERRNEKN